MQHFLNILPLLAITAILPMVKFPMFGGHPPDHITFDGTDVNVGPEGLVKLKSLIKATKVKGVIQTPEGKIVPTDSPQGQDLIQRAQVQLDNPDFSQADIDSVMVKASKLANGGDPATTAITKSNPGPSKPAISADTYNDGTIKFTNHADGTVKIAKAGQPTVTKMAKTTGDSNGSHSDSHSGSQIQGKKPKGGGRGFSDRPGREAKMERRPNPVSNSK